MSCKERNFGVIGEIRFFSEQEITFAQSFFLPKRTLVLGEDVVENSTGGLLPMKPNTAKMYEKEIHNRAGDGYEVVVSWEVMNPTASEYAQLELLKSGNMTLKISVFYNSFAYIRSVEDAYRFEYNESEGIHSCTLTIQNISGIQRII